MAAAVVVALLEGGAIARAETANSAWFYTTSNSGSANADKTLSSVQSLSRFAQADTTGVPLVFASASVLGGGRMFDVTAPLGKNLAVEFGSRFGNRIDFAGLDSGALFANPADLLGPFSTTAREVHAQSAIGLGNGLSLNFGESFGANDTLLPAFGPAWMQTPLGGAKFMDSTAQEGFAALNWDVAPWADLGLVARQASAQGAPAAQSAALSPSKLSTQTLGVSGRVAFGSGWVTKFSYNEGVAQLDLRSAANLLAEDGSQHSRSYGVAIAKHGLFGDDTLGLAVSQSSEPAAGSINLDDSIMADPFDGFISSTTRPILSGKTAETDLQLGYVTTFLDGALALQANAGYQMNSAGQSGNNGVAVLSRAKINF
jgi:hypothetical protein